MFIHDLTNIVTWWFLLFLFNFAGWFSLKRLFSHLPDYGYPLVKIVGLAFVSYTTWLLASHKILPFSQQNAFLVFCFFVFVNLVLIKKFNLVSTIASKTIKIILFEELLFLFGIFFWAVIRSFNPAILGLEKFMDFSIINSILRSNYFPPLDVWLTGNTVNYYYFGHFVTALLIKLISIKPSIAFNLMLGTVFGLTISGVFSISYNLFSLSVKKENIKKAILVGLLAAFLVALSGNLHTIYIFTKGYEIGDATARPPWEVLGKPNPQNYWYPSAVRFIPYTIHEIPSYSFIVSDLHAHLLDIPFVLTTITLVLSFSLQLSKLLRQKIIISKIFAPLLLHILPLSILLSVLYMTNPVDGMIYTLLFLIFCTAIFYRHGYGLIKSFFITFTITLFICVINLMSVFPFSSHFVPFISGLGVNCGEIFGKILKTDHLGPIFFDANKCQHSKNYMLLIIWGFQLFVSAFYVFSRWKERRINFADNFLLICCFLSWLLIIFPEFFYLRDIYPVHFRANTMFKFGYQAFILLSIFCAVAIFTTKIKSKIVRHVYLFFIVLQLFLVGIYPFFGIKSYYQELNSYQGLDGNNFWNKSEPSDLEAINWFQKNVTGQPTIIEAVGEAYSNYSRISSFTGLPTIIGWPGHEWGWHQSGKEAYQRVAEVQRFYESENVALQKEIITKYAVKYIILGNMERRKYLKLRPENLDLLGRKVFETPNLTIYGVGH